MINKSLIFLVFAGMGALLLSGLNAECAMFLNKVVSQRANKTDSNLELGVLELYFSQYPKLSPVSSLSHGMEQLVFFFDQARVKTAECKNMIAALNASSGDAYAVQLDVVDKPKRGIQLTIRYDRKKVEMKYGKLDAIDLQKKITFHFYDKAFIEQLRLSNKALLRVVIGKETPYEHVFT